MFHRRPDPAGPAGDWNAEGRFRTAKCSTDTGRPTPSASSGRRGGGPLAPAGRGGSAPFRLSSRRAAPCAPGCARHASRTNPRARDTGCPLLGLGRRRRPAPALAAPPAARRAARSSRSGRACGPAPATSGPRQPSPRSSLPPSENQLPSGRLIPTHSAARRHRKGSRCRARRPVARPGGRGAAALLAPLQCLRVRTPHASRRLRMAAFSTPT